MHLELNKFDGQKVTKWIKKYENETLRLVKLTLMSKLISMDDDKQKETIERKVEEIRIISMETYTAENEKDRIGKMVEESDKWEVLKKKLIDKYKTEETFSTLKKLTSKKVVLEKVEDYITEFNEIMGNIPNYELPSQGAITRLFLMALPADLYDKVIENGMDEKTEQPKELSKIQELTLAQLKKLEKLNTFFTEEREVEKKKVVDNEGEMNELVKQLEDLRIQMARLQNQKPLRTCIICENEQCKGKKYCLTLKDLIRTNKVKLNQDGFVTWPNGETIPLNRGKGGIAKLVGEFREVKQVVFDDVVEVNEIVELPEALVNYLDYLADMGKEEEARQHFENFMAEKRKGIDKATQEKKRFRPWEGEIKEEEKVEKPKFKYALPNMDIDAAIKSVKEKLLDTIVPNLTVRDILAISPNIRKEVEVEIKPKKVTVTTKKVVADQSELDFDRKRPVREGMKTYVDTPVVQGAINHMEFDLHIDGGSQVNVMPLSTCLKLGVPMTKINGGMITASSERVSFCGQVTVDVTIKGITVNAPVFVIPKASYDCLLGRPWISATRHGEQSDDDGNVIHTIHSSDGVMEATFITYNKGLKAYHCSYFVSKMSIELEKEVSKNYTVNGKYKPVSKKVRPQAVDLQDGSKPFQWKAAVVKELTKEEKKERIAQLKVGIGEFLSKEEEEEVREMLYENIEAFAFEPNEIGRIKPEVIEPYRIRTVPHVPWCSKQSPVPARVREAGMKLLKERIESGILEPCHGPYSNRFWLVPKKNGELRFVQDLQPLNKVTIRDAGVPPDKESYTEDFAGYPIYASFDLMSGYDQYPLDVASRDLTAIRVPGMGLFRMTTMPQGGTNSVQAFQAAMSRIYEEFIPANLVAFVDDIPVKPSTKVKDETLVKPGVRKFVYDFVGLLDRILRTTISAGLKFSAAKSSIAVPETTILGQICSLDGRIPGEEKWQKALDWGKFQSTTQVRGFLGLASVFRKWIYRFSEIAEPLYRLTKKGVPFAMDIEQLEAVELIKEALRSYPVLRPLDFKRKMIVNVDSGPKGGGGYLGQDDDEGNRYICEYVSFMYSPTVQNYSQVKREMYAILRILRTLKLKIFGCEIVVETDCLPVIAMINNPDVIDPVLLRWTAYIRLFNPIFKHVKGSKQNISDGLSRKVPSKEEEETDWMKEEIDVEEAVDYTIKTVHMEMIDEECPIEYRYIIEYLSTARKPEGLNDVEFRKVRRKSYNYFVQNDILWKKRGKVKLPVKVIWKKNEKLKILKELHDENGHRGVEGTFTKVLERYYWKNFYSDVKEYVESCLICQKMALKRLEEPMNPVIIPALNRTWYVDLQLMPKASGYIGILEAREGLTGWIEAKMVKKKDEDEWIQFIYQSIICRYGCVGRIISDNGELNSKKGIEFLEKHCIEFVTTTTYHPQGNAPVERGHKPIRNAIERKTFTSIAHIWDETDTEDLKREWPKYFYAALWADRMTVKKTTGYTPYHLMYGSQCIIPVELETESWYVSNWKYPMTEKELLAARVKQLAKREIDIAQATAKLKEERLKSKAYFDKNKNIRKEKLKEGDLVLMFESHLEVRITKKFKILWTGPYVILKVHENGTYLISQLDYSATEVVAGNRLKLFKTSELNVQGTNISRDPVNVELYSTTLMKMWNFTSLNCHIQNCVIDVSQSRRVSLTSLLSHQVTYIKYRHKKRLEEKPNRTELGNLFVTDFIN